MNFFELFEQLLGVAHGCIIAIIRLGCQPDRILGGEGKAKIGICSRGLAFSLVRDNVAMLNSRKPFFPSAVQKVI